MRTRYTQYSARVWYSRVGLSARPHIARRAERSDGSRSHTRSKLLHSPIRMCGKECERVRTPASCLRATPLLARVSYRVWHSHWSPAFAYRVPTDQREIRALPPSPIALRAAACRPAALASRASATSARDRRHRSDNKFLASLCLYFDIYNRMFWKISRGSDEEMRCGSR